MDLNATLAGKFIVFDGPDGSGKTTQIRRATDALTRTGLEVVYAKDPGGTEIGERIREVLLHHDLSRMDVRCETFLFMASRAQLVSEVVEPAIAAGKVVLGDRYISATCAYQGAAGYDIQRVLELGAYAVGETWPDLTLILDLPIEAGFARTGRKPHHAGRHRKRHDGDQGVLFDNAQTDAMEARPLDFHRRVREMFLALPGTYPSRLEVIDAGGSEDEVHGRIMEALSRVDP